MGINKRSFLASPSTIQSVLIANRLEERMTVFIFVYDKKQSKALDISAVQEASIDHKALEFEYI